jgi:hypothetical protein
LYLGCPLLFVVVEKTRLEPKAQGFSNNQRQRGTTKMQGERIIYLKWHGILGKKN